MRERRDVALLLAALLAVVAGGWLAYWQASQDSGEKGKDRKAGDGEKAAPTATLPRDGETADAEALARLSDWRLMPVFDHGVYLQQSSADRADRTAKARTVMLSRGNRDMNNFVCEGGGTQKSGNPGVPIRVDLERCPEEYVRGFVMSRFEGSGRLARLWMTSTSMLKLHHRDEVLRVYVDGRREPLIRVPLVDAASGRGHEIFAPPFGAGSRFFLAWYYPVVFASKLIISLDRVRPSESYYHQTVVVLDRERRPRKRAAARLPARDRAAAALRGKAGLDDRAGLNVESHGGPVKLAPGERVTALDLTGPGTVRQVKVVAAGPEVLREVRLQVRWDDDAGAAIELPLLALFGSELTLPAKPGPILSAQFVKQKVQLLLRMPMPFRSRAEFSLHNRGQQQVQMQLEVKVEKALPPEPFGRLYTQYFETIGPTEKSHHSLARASGRGRLVGVCMAMQGHGLAGNRAHSAPLNFLEGDERGVVDGRLAIRGTGTEDYFNSSFYFADGAFATVFAQGHKVRRDRDGEAVCCRWHVLGDAVDFASSLDLSMEIGPGQPSLLDRYRSVAFLYR